MNINSANALLKILEEPQKNSLFFIISHSKESVLPTIRSRCLNLRFNKFSDYEITNFLNRKIIDEEKEELKDSTKKAELTEESLKVALKQEIGQGLVSVEKQEDKVIVTVGAGGAFPSGTAQLTPAAKKIMSNIAEINKKGSSTIKVTGHTDNVPLLFGSQYRDNWDLAAARAASVVQNLQETNVIDAKRLIATSKGETQPIASNQTRQGRSKNRRIEIEINYGK